MKYLFVTHTKFWNLSQGSEYVINDRIVNLPGEKVVVFIGKVNEDDQKKLTKYDLRFYNLKSINYLFFKLIRLLFSKIGFNPYCLQKPYRFSLAARKRVKKICKKENVDCVICEYVWFYHLLDKVDNKICKVIDTHDIQNLFCAQNGKIDKNWRLNITKEDEIKAYSKFDYVLALSKDDYSYFSKDLNNTYYLPPTYPEQNFSKVDSNVLSVGFIGGRAQFNADAVEWFITNVMEHIDNVIFNVYGGVCDGFNERKNTVFHGVVKNISEIYENNHLMVNPTFISGGIKTKNVEALSYGKYVLTTTFGARGLNEFVDAGFIIVCNEGEKYCDYLEKYKNDLNHFQKGEAIINKFDEVFSKENYVVFDRKIEELRKQKL